MKQVLANITRIMSTLVVFVCVAWFGLMILSYQQELRAGNTDMAGIHKLDELAARDVASLENAIRNSRAASAQQPETAETQAEAAPRADMKTRFANSVVMGDSITKALEDYEFLDSTSVVAKNGINLAHVQPELERAVELNPKNIFMSYGMNDLEYLWGNPQKFEELYENAVRTLQESLPDTKIYINGILPIQQKAIDKKPLYGNVDAYNEALVEMCTRLGLPFIDNSGLMQQEDIYQEDGIHPKPHYYPSWLENMASKAGI